MYWTPCSFRLFASKSAPLISAIFSLLSVTQSLGGRTPTDGRRAVRPDDRRMPRGADYLFIDAQQMGLSGDQRRVPRSTRPTGTLVTLPRYNSTAARWRFDRRLPP